MSPKGFEGVREAANDIESRRSSGFAGGADLWFKLQSGESATVRFLEQGEEFTWCWMHEMPPRGKQRWGDDSPCLDQDKSGQPCPGCEAGLDKKFKAFIPLIWREGPIFKKNAEGRIEKGADNRPIVEGKADQIAIWERGIQTAQELDGKDATYKGLRSRDFTISRRGATMNDTVYIIEPAVGDDGETKATPMSKADEDLVAEKPDMSQFVTPVAYDTMKGWLGQPTAPQNQGSPDQVPGADVNPFLRS